MALPEKPITRIEKYLSAWAGEGETPQNPITREEMYLDAIVNGGEAPTTPITRVEKLYDAIAKGETDLSSPITRKEQYLYSIATGGEKPSKPITRIEMYLNEIDGGGSGGHIYGAVWDGSSTTAWTRTDDAASFADPVPAVNNGTGSSPFDTLMPWSGIVKEERTGGTMVKIPKFWFKWTSEGNSLKLQISDAPNEGFLVSPAHQDRGDGVGERDFVYVGRYHSGADYKSTTGVKPNASITRSTARSSIHALGNNIWQYDFAMWQTILMLYLVEFADWNSQAKIGYGCGNNSSSTENVGATDTMLYHTGTVKPNRTDYGVGVQYRWIEDLWGNVYDWLDGCYYNASGLNLIKNPANFSDSSGGTNIGMPSNSSPTAMSVATAVGFEFAIYPKTDGGNENAYVPDRWYFSSSRPCLCVGGNFSQLQDHGLFYVNSNRASSTTANIGCRLQELP